jgi:hypothetical protein
MKLNYRRGQHRKFVARRHRPGRGHHGLDPHYEAIVHRKFRRKTRTRIHLALARDDIANLILPRTLNEVEDIWNWD